MHSSDVKNLPSTVGGYRATSYMDGLLDLSLFQPLPGCIDRAGAPKVESAVCPVWSHAALLLGGGARTSV